MAVLYANYVAYDQFFRPAPLGHWGDQALQGRNPASAQQDNLPVLDLPQLIPFEDYFQYDTHNGYVTYDMGVSFWTDKGLRHFKKYGKKAIEDGLKKTFGEMMKDSSGNKKLPATAPKFIIKEAINKFVYNLKFYKLIDLNFELDLEFAPRNVNFNNYYEELQTNQLVNIDKKGTLVKSLNSFDQTLPQKILTADIPSTGHIYQYLGGAITIAPEILDTTWKITKPIPNPKKNALKGLVRLRKYYRVNQTQNFDLKTLFKDQKDLDVDVTLFKTKKKFKTPFITVDTIYSFNLENLLPKKERVVIHFGKLISLDKKHDNIVKRILQVFKKSNDIKTSDLIITGKYTGHGEIMPENFEAQLKRIEYDVKKKKFTKVNFHTFSGASATSDVEYDLKQGLLKGNAEEFIKQLELGLLLSSEKI